MEREAKKTGAVRYEVGQIMIRSPEEGLRSSGVNAATRRKNIKKINWL